MYSGPETALTWAGTVVLAAGALAFVRLSVGLGDRVDRRVVAATAAIPALAATSYAVTAAGYGITTVSVGVSTVSVPWVRYADWLVTTPLLLFVLASLAGVDRRTTAALVVLDVGMIFAGLFGALTGTGSPFLVLPLAPAVHRLVWWGLGSLLLAGLLTVLWVTLTDRAYGRSHEVGRLFEALRNLTAGLWVAYPVVWLLGSGGTLGDPGLVSPGVEALLFVTLDVLAKLGFGYILLRSARDLALPEFDVGEAEADAEAAD
jgi:bacteriorhodopsin